MTTRVSQFMGGLGIDARNKLTVHANSTVVLGTTGASGTSNLFVGKAVVAGLTFPTSDGSSGQFLKTDGAGTLSFSTVDTNLVSDTSPQLGGGLDMNGNDITGTTGDRIILTSDGTNSVMSIKGGGPNYIQFLDNTSTTNAVTIAYRTTPHDLRIERRENGNIIGEFGGDDGHAALYFNNSKKIETVTAGIEITGTLSTTDDITTTGLRLNNTVGNVITTIGSLASTDLGILRVSAGTGSSDSHGFNIKYMGSRSGVNNSFSLFMDNQDGTDIEAITVLQDGKVGINKTAPTEELEVTGNIKASGTLNGHTIPGGSGTLALTTDIAAGTVTESGTQTLTNKTLTVPTINAPVMTIPDISGGANLKNGSTSAGFLKFYEDSDNGTNAVTLIGPASTADVTLTLPSATDTLVVKATTDTLTNKTLTTPTIASITNGGTVTIPSGTDTLVARTSTDTLTNKTLTTPTLTTPVINNGADIKNGATSAGFIKFFEDSDNGTNAVTLQGPASTADVTLTLPAHAGTMVAANANGTIAFANAEITSVIKAALFSGDGGGLSNVTVSGTAADSLLSSDTDCGTLTSANTTSSTDAFGQALSQIDIADCLDSPPNSLGTVDNGALS